MPRLCKRKGRISSGVISPDRARGRLQCLALRSAPVPWASHRLAPLERDAIDQSSRVTGRARSIREHSPHRMTSTPRIMPMPQA